MRYRKKPVVVEAWPWGGYPNLVDGTIRACQQGDDNVARCSGCGEFLSHHAEVKTLEGWHIVCPGDWLIRGVKGEYYPCKPDIFEMTYEEAQDE